MQRPSDMNAEHKPFTIAMGVLFAVGVVALGAAWWMLGRVEDRIQRQGAPALRTDAPAEPRRGS